MNIEWQNEFFQVVSFVRNTRNVLAREPKPEIWYEVYEGTAGVFTPMSRNFAFSTQKYDEAIQFAKDATKLRTKVK